MRLTEAQYTLLCGYEDTGPREDGTYRCSWKDLSNGQQRTLGVLLGQNLLAYQGEGFHLITESGRQALVDFRVRYGLSVSGQGEEKEQ